MCCHRLLHVRGRDQSLGQPLGVPGREPVGRLGRQDGVGAGRQLGQFHRALQLSAFPQVSHFCTDMSQNGIDVFRDLCKMSNANRCKNLNSSREGNRG